MSNPISSLPRRHSDTERDKATVLEALAAGKNITEALALIGRTRSAYDKWRTQDPPFRYKADAARIKAHGENGGGWQGDFATFRDTYFKLEYPTPSFHMELIKKIESAPPMSITLVLVPPNFGKSTLLEDWCNYKLALDPNHRITIVSKGQAQARKMLARVARRMTDQRVAGEYIARFGPFYEEGQEREGRPWTRDYFTVKKMGADGVDERDYSLQVLGWTGQVYGSRVDTLILDDVVTRDNLSRIDEMMEKFRLEFATRMGRTGRIVIIGTRIEVGDFYERLIDQDVITRGQLVIRPAVNHAGESLWPERWPMDALATMRKNVGEKAWWCGYQQQPALGGAATFSEEMINEAKDHLRRIGTGPNGDVRHGLPVVLGLDPALGGGNALVCLAYDDARIYLLDAHKDIGLARTEDILTRVEEFAIRYAPNDLVIEAVAFQRGLARDDRMVALSRKYGFRIHEHQTNRNKLDPVLGVGSMAGSFIRGEVSIPWADTLTQAKMEPLCAELRAWRPTIPTRLLVQDFVMAFWFGWLWLMQRRRFVGASPSDWKRRALPYEPMRALGVGGQ